MKWAIVIVLVVALVALLFYAARANAETPPAEPVTPPTPTPPMYTAVVQPMLAEAPTVVFERTAEEIWRADVMRAAQDYERALTVYAARFPTSAPARKALVAARAIAAAAPMESRASLLFRLAFVSGPPAGAGAARRTWDMLTTAIRSPIMYRPTLPVVPVVVSGIVPLGDFSV